MTSSNNTSLHLTQKEYAFMQNMAEQCAGSGSYEISTATILRTMVRLLQHLEVNLLEVETEDQLLERLQSALKNNQIAPV